MRQQTNVSVLIVSRVCVVLFVLGSDGVCSPWRIPAGDLLAACPPHVLAVRATANNNNSAATNEPSKAVDLKETPEEEEAANPNTPIETSIKPEPGQAADTKPTVAEPIESAATHMEC